jgi:hypothetical protein
MYQMKLQSIRNMEVLEVEVEVEAVVKGHQNHPEQSVQKLLLLLVYLSKE